MKIVKRIIVDVFDDGSTEIREENFPNVNKEVNTGDNQIKEIVWATDSWDRYHVITFSRKKSLFKALEKSKGEKIQILFLGKFYYGVIGGNIPRIHGVHLPHKFVAQQKIELALDPISKILNITIVEE